MLTNAQVKKELKLKIIEQVIELLDMKLIVGKLKTKQTIGVSNKKEGIKTVLIMKIEVGLMIGVVVAVAIMAVIVAIVEVVVAEEVEVAVDQDAASNVVKRDILLMLVQILEIKIIPSQNALNAEKLGTNLMTVVNQVVVILGKDVEEDVGVVVVVVIVVIVVIVVAVGSINQEVEAEKEIMKDLVMALELAGDRK